MEPLQFALLGLGSGAVVAALAIGLTLVYRGSGVVNFAFGAMAMYCTYTYSSLVGEGRLFLPPLPVPGWPEALAFGSPLAPGLAFVVSLGVAAVMGLAVHYLVFRPLRFAPALAKLVAAVGLMMLLQGIVVYRFGTDAVNVRPVLPSDAVDVFGATVPADRLLLAGLVVAVAVGLWAVFRYTRFGIATRAAAENERATTLLGFSADAQAGATWVAASVLAAAIGILVAPLTSLTPTNYTLLVIPALAAALAGRLQSVGIAAAAGLAIGVLQSEVQLAEMHVSWIPGGLQQALPFLLIVLVMVVRGQRVPGRDALTTVSLPRAPAARNVRRTLAIVLPIAILVLIFLPFGPRAALVNSMAGAMLCLSLVVLTGYLGQVSLAQMAVAGFAAFGLSTLALEAGVPFPLAPLLAAAVSALVGLVIAMPALRVRGVELAILTLAAGYAVEKLVFDHDGWFGGEGGAAVPSPSLAGVDLGQAASFPLGDGKLPSPVFGLFLLAVLVALCLFVVALRRRPLGRQMLAVRSNERGAASAGVDVTFVKVVGFGIAAFMAGIGGAMLAYRSGEISPISFDVQASLVLLAFAYLGGISTLSGAMIGGFLITGGLGFYLMDEIVGIGEIQLIVAGVALIVSAAHSQEGAAGVIHGLLARRRRNAAVAAETPALPDVRSGAVPSALADAETPPVAVPVGGDPLLVIEGLTVDYGGVRALDDVSLTVRQGTITGLIGPNGAGKTTLIDAVTGFAPASGNICFDGSEISGLAPHLRTRRGMTRTWQSLELFDDLTVAENVAVAAERVDWRRSSGRDDETVEARVDRALGDLGLCALAGRYPSDVSLGQRKLIGVARALAGGASLVLLDEPAAGLDSVETRELAAALRVLPERGVSLLLVDHDMDLVMSSCATIHVLAAGRLIAGGPAAEIRTNEAVVTAYLGPAQESLAATGGHHG